MYCSQSAAGLLIKTVKHKEDYRITIVIRITELMNNIMRNAPFRLGLVVLQVHCVCLEEVAKVKTSGGKKELLSTRVMFDKRCDVVAVK